MKLIELSERTGIKSKTICNMTSKLIENGHARKVGGGEKQARYDYFDSAIEFVTNNKYREYISSREFVSKLKNYMKQRRITMKDISARGNISYYYLRRVFENKTKLTIKMRDRICKFADPRCFTNIAEFLEIVGIFKNIEPKRKWDCVCYDSCLLNAALSDSIFFCDDCGKYQCSRNE